MAQLSHRSVRQPLNAGLVAIAFLVAACSSGEANDEGGDDTSSTFSARDERVSLTDDEALDLASDNLQGATYADLGEPYGCTDDCSGHEAGVAWAQDVGIVDPDVCGGHSQSFIEGCMAYAEALQNEAEELSAD